MWRRNGVKVSEFLSASSVKSVVADIQNMEGLIMRMLLKISIPVEAGNEAIKSGTIGCLIESILAEQKPEAAYFTLDNGMRTGFIFLDIQEPSQIPTIAEPWFLAFNADIDMTPVMTGEDLAKAGPSIGAAVEKYG